MCSTVQEQITTCGQNAIVKIGERTNIRPQKADLAVMESLTIKLFAFKKSLLDALDQDYFTCAC